MYSGYLPTVTNILKSNKNQSNPFRETTTEVTAVCAIVSNFVVLSQQMPDVRAVAHLEGQLPAGCGRLPGRQRPLPVLRRVAPDRERDSG